MSTRLEQPYAAAGRPANSKAFTRPVYLNVAFSKVSALSMVLSTMPTKVRTEEILAREYPCPLPAGLAQIDPKRSSPRDPALKIVERLALQLECQRLSAWDSRTSLPQARLLPCFTRWSIHDRELFSLIADSCVLWASAGFITFASSRLIANSGRPLGKLPSELTSANSRRRTHPAQAQPSEIRSEERRVGKECRTVCRSRWSPYH